MTLTKKITLALGLFAAAAASFAQTTTTGAAPVGVLGQRYTEVHFEMQEIDFVSPNLYSVGASVNLPVSSGLDLGASYSYGRIRGDVRGHSNTLAAAATAYTEWSGLKPFVGAALGYQWTRFAGFSDDGALWGVAVGAEIPVGAFAITPRLIYADDFESGANSSEQLTSEVEGNYWFSPNSAVFATLGYTDVIDTRVDSWNYRVGLRVKF